MWAPTFRESLSEEQSLFSALLEDSTVSLINHSLSEHDTILYVKPHPYTTISSKHLREKLSSYHNIVFENPYVDINDLLLNSSCIITDYSSIVYDAYAMGIGICIYLCDLGQYSSTRGLNTDYSSFAKSSGYASLLDAITSYLTCSPLYKDRQLSIRRFISSTSGYHYKQHSCKRIYQEIICDTTP